MQKFILVFFLIACSRYQTPELPDLEKKTFSSEEIWQKQKELEEKIKKINA
ncbi:MAG: hypothetical protein LBF54_04550 [Holosporaceae bacterium]|jgi:hypothetical protein|nr:hypothetical protein [Holosporaceae bacterium]